MILRGSTFYQITLGWESEEILAYYNMRNTPTASQQNGNTPPLSTLFYDTKQSDGEAPVMPKLNGLLNTPLWPSLLGPLGPGAVGRDGSKRT